MSEPTVTAISAEIMPAAMGVPARLTIVVRAGDAEHRVTLDHETNEFPAFSFGCALRTLGTVIAREGQGNTIWLT